MLVVSNTSPILNLALIDRLSLIREQFTTVTIPKGVLEELRVGENLPGSKKILDALDAKWLQVEEIQDSAMLRILKRELDAGEAEAIAMALEMRQHSAAVLVYLRLNK
jgi:predicted nucleic acid-binding protein